MNPFLALFLAATSDLVCAAPPEAWTRWRQERRAEIGGTFSPAALVAMVRLRADADQILERRGEAWSLRLATEPARGAEAARFSLSGGTATASGRFGALALPDGREVVASSAGLGLLGYDRGAGKFTVLAFDLNKKGLEDLKRVDVFPYDPAFAVKARAVHLAPERVSFMHSDGDIREMERVGRLEFSLQGRPQALSVHGDKDGREMFVLFKDPTNGKRTYGAGRFYYLKLDKPWPQVEALDVDLNFAFSPYCRYSRAYSCPLATDRVDAPVEAGERMPPLNAGRAPARGPRGS